VSQNTKENDLLRAAFVIRAPEVSILATKWHRERGLQFHYSHARVILINLIRESAMKYLKAITNFCGDLLRRPLIWILGLFVASATAYFTPIIQDIAQPILSTVSEKICHLRRSPIQPEESKFTILVSPLSGDVSQKHTGQVFRAFLPEQGFRVFVICESLSFNDLNLFGPPKDQTVIARETIAKGEMIIKKNLADLLLFGIVEDQSLRIWAINEHGGCDLDPKSFTISKGIDPNELDINTKIKLIAKSLSEIAAGCQNPESIDWALFEKRIKKIETFIRDSSANLPADQLDDIMQHYYRGMYLLCAYGEWKELWFKKASNLNKQFLEKLPPGSQSNIRASEIWYEQAALFVLRADKTKDIADIRSTIDAYTRSIELNPNNPLAFYNRGVTYWQINEPQLMFKDLDEAIRLDPKNSDFIFSRAHAYAENRQFDRAIQDYSEVIRLKPTDSDSYYRRGNVYSNKGQYDLALQDYDQAIALNPDHVGALSSRGNVYNDKGQYDRAIADYDRAIKLNPNEAIIFYNRGFAYHSKGQNDRAIMDYDQAIKLNPNYAIAFNGRGIIYHSKGQNDRAIADYDQAIKLNPKYADAYSNRGRIYLLSGYASKALADFKQASDIEPKNAYLALWLEIAGRRNTIPSHLAKATNQLDMTAWPAPIVRLFLGEMTPSAVFDAADDANPTTKQGRVCETNFYSGEYALLQNTREEALRLFRLAANDCPKELIEWDAANTELKVLGATP
jgi:tetratricopeptide (TPR) repeat protein